MILKPRDILLLAAVCVVFVVVAIVVRMAVPSLQTILIACLALAIVLAALVGLYRQIHELLRWHHTHPTQNYRQIEAMFSLFSALKIDGPLPAMRGSAVSPDFANTLISLIRTGRPNQVVELGSGVSTLIAGYCVKQLQHGRVTSLEQDREYAEQSRVRLMEHGLGDVVTLLHAPLIEQEFGGHRAPWYDTDALVGINQIDLLVVDGPLQIHQPDSMIRYPALPALMDRLSKNAIILVDDCHRDDEGRIIQRWMREYPDLQLEQTRGEKQHVVLRRGRTR